MLNDKDLEIFLPGGSQKPPFGEGKMFCGVLGGHALYRSIENKTTE
jgi:hypothetical protein